MPGGQVVEVADLERRRAAEELHGKMAEALLAAESHARARDLVHRGVASAADFVVEDVGQSLDADAVAETAREQNAAEQPERAALREAQAAELAEAEGEDKRRRLEGAAREADAALREEEAEAREVWAAMDRECRLERLPAEPDGGEAGEGVLALTVVLPGSGRRLSRRWRAADPVGAVSEFAFGMAEESELPHAEGAPGLVFGFPPCTLAPDDGRGLREAGLATREVLRALRRPLPPAPPVAA